jgi:hypothetical protein
MRRMITSVIGLGVFLVAAVLHGASLDARWTAGMMNGLMWRQMDDVAKTYYVAGILELSSTINNKQQGAVIDVDKCKCNAGALVEGVDAFYKTANDEWLRLPVTSALAMDSQRRSGIPLEKLAVYYAQFLKMVEELDKQQRGKH